MLQNNVECDTQQVVYCIVDIYVCVFHVMDKTNFAIQLVPFYVSIVVAFELALS